MPVFADETYYYIWSLHPQLSYFDHPPMVSWFISLSHILFPAGNPLALRFPFVISGFAVILIWCSILKEKSFTNLSIFYFLIFLTLNPLLGLGSVVATPDVPLTLFWTLSYFSFQKILKSGKMFWYSLLGVFLGLGFCSKYHIVLFVLFGLIYIFFTKKYKKIKFGGVLLTILFGGCLSAPVIIWNAQNNWASFAFQLSHGFGEESFSWSWPLGYIIAQTLIINPFILFSLFKKAFINIDRFFSLSQLGFFLTSSFKSVVEGNWPITSHFHSIAHFCTISKKRVLTYALTYWLFFYILIFAFFMHPVSQPVKKNMVNTSQIQELLEVAENYKPLYGASYQIASLLSWRTQSFIPKLAGMSRYDFFDTLPESKPEGGVFYVLKNDYSEWPSQYIIYNKKKLQSFDKLGLELYQFKYE